MANYVKGVERGRSGSVKIDSDSETLVAVVIADDKYYSPTQIAYTPGLPTVGGWFDFLGYVRTDLRLESIDPQQDSKNPYVWRCTLNYNTKPAGDPNEDPTDQAARENPLLKKADIKIGKRSIVRAKDMCYGWGISLDAITSDLSNNTENEPVTNSAKQRFTDPPVEEEEWLRCYFITKNVSVQDQLYLEDEYSDEIINTDTITIRGKVCEPCTLKMPPPEFDIARGGPQGTYWVARFEVFYKKNTWIREYLDRGSKDIDGKPWTGAAVYGNEVHNLNQLGSFLPVNTDGMSIFMRTKLAKPMAPLFQYWSQ